MAAKAIDEVYTAERCQVSAEWWLLVWTYWIFASAALESGVKPMKSSTTEIVEIVPSHRDPLNSFLSASQPWSKCYRSCTRVSFGLINHRMSNTRAFAWQLQVEILPNHGHCWLLNRLRWWRKNRKILTDWCHLITWSHDVFSLLGTLAAETTVASGILTTIGRAPDFFASPDLRRAELAFHEWRMKCVVLFSCWLSLFHCLFLVFFHQKLVMYERSDCCLRLG